MRFEKMYNIEPLDDTEPWYTAEAQKRWEESVLKDLWKSFEEEIGNPNVDEMQGMAESLTTGMPEYGVKDMCKCGRVPGNRQLSCGLGYDNSGRSQQPFGSWDPSVQ